MANAYKAKLARLKAKQSETNQLIDDVREKAFSAFDAVEGKGGTIPTNPDDRKLGDALNDAIGSIKTDNMPVDDESEQLYFGCDASGCYFASDADDETDVAYGRDSTGIYGRNQTGGEQDG